MLGTASQKLFHIIDTESEQEEYHDQGRVKFREFKLNEVVLVSYWRSGIEKWIPGQTTQVKSPRTYLVRRRNLLRFVHMDHSKGTGCNPSLGSVAGGKKSSEGAVEERGGVGGVASSREGLIRGFTLDPYVHFKCTGVQVHFKRTRSALRF